MRGARKGTLGVVTRRVLAKALRVEARLMFFLLAQDVPFSELKDDYPCDDVVCIPISGVSSNLAYSGRLFDEHSPVSVCPSGVQCAGSRV